MRPDRGTEREVLTDGVRHAEAHEVGVLLSSDAEATTLGITDDGRELDTVDLDARVTDGHTGLSSVRARVGGRFVGDRTRERDRASSSPFRAEPVPAQREDVSRPRPRCR